MNLREVSLEALLETRKRLLRTQGPDLKNRLEQIDNLIQLKKKNKLS